MPLIESLTNSTIASTSSPTMADEMFGFDQVIDRIR
jgi:hypothetical protein